MFRFVLAPCAFALASIVSPVALATAEADLTEIRNEIRQLKESYEARIEALERRLKAAEAKSAAAPAEAKSAAAPAEAKSVAAPTAEVASTPTPPAAALASGIAAFNPALSVVLQGVYANMSQDPNQYAIAGFAPSGDIAPARRGFSIAESELTLTANVDDKFYGNLTFSLSPQNTVEVEEAYGLYTAAPWGLAPKFGRFLSGIGYLNDIHQHAWDFYDAPLVYQAFLGGQYRNDGLQVKWVAPTDLFVEFGGEVGNGAPFPGTDRNKNGIGNGNAYVHLGGDIGASQSWRAGVSYLQTAARERAWTQSDLAGNDANLAFTGRSRLAIADFVWKWAPNGNARDTSFKLQGEYFWRRESGDLAYSTPGASGLSQNSGYRSDQRGFYAQGVWQFMPEWRVGARYDRLDPGSVDYAANSLYLATGAFNPQRAALMLDWTPSEFSRFRVQFQQAKLKPDLTDNEIFVQYILTLGAHGAHKF